jgi:CBS domain-containing protein
MFAEYEIADQLLVRDLMTERPCTTTPDTPLRKAARELIRTGLGGLPVVDHDNRFLGMLSERELMRHLLATEVLSDGTSRHAPAVLRDERTVRDVMTRQVLCVAPEQPAAEVAALMSNKDVERVPVVREGKLVGFLTRGDIVRKLIGP